jgi:hypothetical protein
MKASYFLAAFLGVISVAVASSSTFLFTPGIHEATLAREVSDNLKSAEEFGKLNDAFLKLGQVQDGRIAYNQSHESFQRALAADAERIKIRRVRLIVAAVLLSAPVFFLPTFLAVKHLNFWPIFLLNLFLGVTFVGWVAALIWSIYRSPTPPHPVPE